MSTQHTNITHLSLLRKYNGNIKLAHESEMRAAARSSLSVGENALTALFDATSTYEKEQQDHRQNGVMSRVCSSEHDLCDEDHCRCRR